MCTSNEAPGMATSASPHNRLAWLLARQHRLAGVGPPETLEMVSWPPFCDTVCGIPCPEFLMAGTAQRGGQSWLYRAREVGMGREGGSIWPWNGDVQGESSDEQVEKGGKWVWPVLSWDITKFSHWSGHLFLQKAYLRVYSALRVPLVSPSCL